MALVLRRLATTSKPWNTSLRSLSTSHALLRGPSTGAYPHPKDTKILTGKNKWPSTGQSDKFGVRKKTGPIGFHEVRQRLAAGIQSWCKDKSVTSTLQSFGLELAHIKPLLEQFSVAGHSELVAEDDDTDSFYELWRFHQLEELFEKNFEQGIYKAYMNRLIDYGFGPNTPLPPAQASHLQRLRQVTSTDKPSQWFVRARAFKRKLILHVGPTNSGKTYTALRALASAEAGIYGGPLRLLAHEVWERLNNGSIMAPPKHRGVDLLDAGGESERDQTPVDVAGGRACNLLTGEERRIVSPTANLLSCTMEMMPLDQVFDVAVIDEIQMIGDIERGQSWTRAVLGVSAKEVHMCGEATVVDLIRQMAEETGDDFEVHHYQRLTPLSVSKDLQHDFKHVQKGDCVVAFSRKNIFKHKTAIENSTGLRCAVAYGRLPPEVRSEQAERFNDPESGFDVLVASDAIGMGLNLKIKRVVFSTLTKWNGQENEQLSLSQTKQIAGRAGRFGTQGSGQGGLVTTLRPKDIPRLKEALQSENPAIPRAVLELPGNTLSTVYSLLSNGSGIQGTRQVLDLLTLPTKIYAPRSYSHLTEGAKFVDRIASGAPFADIELFMSAPVQWRDLSARDVQFALIQAYFRNLFVPLDPLLETTGCMEAIHDARTFKEQVDRSQDDNITDLDAHAAQETHAKDVLEALEPAHRLVTLYLWLTWRLPLAFRDQDAAFSYKEETERLIAFILGQMRSPSSALSYVGPEAVVSDRKFEWEHESFQNAGTSIRSHPRTANTHLPY